MRRRACTAPYHRDLATSGGRGRERAAGSVGIEGGGCQGFWHYPPPYHQHHHHHHRILIRLPLRHRAVVRRHPLHRPDRLQRLLITTAAASPLSSSSPALTPSRPSTRQDRWRRFHPLSHSRAAAVAADLKMKKGANHVGGDGSN